MKYSHKKRSETVISVSSIPLATYPDAIKLAAHLIDKDETKRAQRVLQTALNTLVVTETVIPLPVATAQALLNEAEQLAETEGRDEDQSQRLTQLLKQARTELEFAQALGYGGEGDFANLYGQLDSIAERTEGGRAESGLFAKIREYLEDTLANSQPESSTGADDRQVTAQTENSGAA